MKTFTSIRQRLSYTYEACRAIFLRARGFYAELYPVTYTRRTTAILTLIQRVRRRYYAWRGFSVILDPADTSVTLSPHLLRHLRRHAAPSEAARVFLFRFLDEYAFMSNAPHVHTENHVEIQYNQQHRCIGFEALCPTVSRILYDYQLPPTHPVHLTVEPVRVIAFPERKFFYMICQPRKV